MSKQEMYFVVECWEDIPGEDDKRLHARLHIGTESGLRNVWDEWNHAHPDRIRYDRIISRNKTPDQAIADLHRHVTYAHP